jgi:hypothetical protein
VAILADLHAFDVPGADLTVWVFKRSTRGGQPVFTGRWVATTEDLDDAIKAAVQERLENTTETMEYGILAQNNEGSALVIQEDETHFPIIAGQAQNPTLGRKATNLKHISNIDFYAIRLSSENGTLFAARKANDSWRTKKTKGVVRAVFSDDELDIDERPAFNIEPKFDFFVLDGTIFISNKGSFESALSYRAGHVTAFGDLTADPQFIALFSELGPIADYVGTNKIQLRRAIAIKEKGHYCDPDFIENLRNNAAAMNLNIAFDHAGRIVPTAETCRDIFQALLDHRLDSRLSQQLYDVQNTAPVN